MKLKEQIDWLQIEVHDDRQEMGKHAGEAVAAKLRQLLAEQSQVRMVFAAAPSQNEMLEYLRGADHIDWSRVTAFHMDEYIGLSLNAPQLFSRFLQRSIFDLVGFGQIHLIDSSADAVAECERYGTLLREAPIDIVCLGIGENGHIAFNDPQEADFQDPHTVKVVYLDQECRQQQVNDGCFNALTDVPERALTLTIPTLMSGRYLYCTVPGATKRKAVAAVRRGPIDISCPASILRKHPSCTMFTDREAYGEVEGESNA
ncbi:6-phosphogluconolactonase [Paenibacillus sp. FA6]|uniref:6-phosphogluconolactonase n=1 Tax=Paenibacillus sp. FA6 TaxID=3413029 RepID=UPI003F65E43F